MGERATRLTKGLKYLTPAEAAAERGRRGQREESEGYEIELKCASVSALAAASLSLSLSLSRLLLLYMLQKEIVKAQKFYVSSETGKKGER